MRICCLSDVHGHLPQIPDCDLLLLAGDYIPACNIKQQRLWIRDMFHPWLDRIAKRNIYTVGIAGNHDFIWERHPELVPQLPWHYLQDTGASVGGLKLWGTPYQPVFMDWAFNLDEPELTAKFSLIPDDTDLLITHCPPFSYGDRNIDGIPCGPQSLTERIQAIQPKLHVCGHIHEGRGMYHCGKTTIVNAAHVDEHYRPVHEPIVIELELNSPSV